MRRNLLFKLLSNLLIILIMLYFIPFLGVCLILLRYFMYGNRKRVSTPMFIVGVGLLILIPKGLYLLSNVVKFDINAVPYLNDIVNAKLYNIYFINYSKFLILVGIIFLIIPFVLETIFDKVCNKISNEIRNYISDTQGRYAEISKQNDMEIKLQQERVKNTSYIKCSNCGSDNILSEKFGTCKYCRRKIENKNYN